MLQAQCRLPERRIKIDARTNGESTCINDAETRCARKREQTFDVFSVSSIRERGTMIPAILANFFFAAAATRMQMQIQRLSKKRNTALYTGIVVYYRAK